MQSLGVSCVTTEHPSHGDDCVQVHNSIRDSSIALAAALLAGVFAASFAERAGAQAAVLLAADEAAIAEFNRRYLQFDQ